MFPYIIVFGFISLVYTSKAILRRDGFGPIDVVVIIIMTIFAAVRGNVGPDTFNYRSTYDELFLDLDISNLFLMEPFISAIFMLFNLLGVASWLALGVLSVLQGLLLYWTAKSLRSGYFIYVYFSLFYLSYEFNIVRQALATQLFGLILLRAIKNLADCKFLNFILIFSIHYLSGLLALFALIWTRLIDGYYLVFLVVSIISLLFLFDNYYILTKFLVYFSALDEGGGRIGPTVILMPAYLIALFFISDKRIQKIGFRIFLLWFLARLSMGYHELFGRLETFFAYCFIVIIFTDDRFRRNIIITPVIVAIGLSIGLATLYFSKDFISVQGIGDVYLESPMVPYVPFWSDFRIQEK